MLEELADDLAHVADRHEHRQDTEGCRHDGERNLDGAVAGRFEGRLAVLEVAVDVFDDDNGVVDKDTDRQAEAHHRHVVEGEAHGLHEEKGGDDRGGDGDGADYRRPGVLQEEEGYQHGQQAAEDQRHGDVLDVFADEAGAVAGDDDLDVGRQDVLLQPSHPRPHAVGDGDGVGAGLLLDGDHDAGNPASDSVVALFLPAVLDGGDVADPDCLQALVGDDDILDVVDVLILAEGADGNLRALLPQSAARGVYVLGVEDVEDLFVADIVRFQFAGIDVDVDLAGLRAVNADVGDVVETLQFVLDYIPGDFADLTAGPGVGRQAVIHDGLGGDVEALHRRLVDLVRQPLPDAGHLLAHVVRHHFGVGAEGELDRRLREALQCDR